MSELPSDRMIPILPCRSIDDQIDFYESLGFEVTYRQKAPNVFAAVQRGDDVLASRLLREASEAKLCADDLAAISDDLARADELRLAIS